MPGLTRLGFRDLVSMMPGEEACLSMVGLEELAGPGMRETSLWLPRRSLVLPLRSLELPLRSLVLPLRSLLLPLMSLWLPP